MQRRMRIKTLAVSAMCGAITLALVAGGFPPRNDAHALAQQGGRAVQETEAEGAVALADPDMEQVLEVFPGDLLGEYQEQYLYAQSNSHAETETPHTASWPSGQWTPHPYATKRWADGNGTFTYRLPVSSSAPAP